MKVTTFAHACVLVEEGNVRFLIDPGTYSSGFDELKDIDAILITHEHADHVDLSGLKAVLKGSPEAVILTNKTVHDILEKEGIKSEVIADGEKKDVKGVSVEGIGTLHALIHSSIPQVENVGFLIAGKLFHPGDSFTDPKQEIEVLALPVAAPWLKIAESIEYAKSVAPKACFPIHDGMLKNPHAFRMMAQNILKGMGVTFLTFKDGESQMF